MDTDQTETVCKTIDKILPVTLASGSLGADIYLFAMLCFCPEPHVVSHTAPCRKAELVAQIAGCNFRGKHVGVTARATQRPEAARPGGARRLCASHKHLI